MASGSPLSRETMFNRYRTKRVTSPLSILNNRTVPFEPKRADEVYRSAEHQRWSKTVVMRANMRCEECGRPGVRLFADHIHEIKDGGSLYELDNGQALCGSCHTVKTLSERAKRLR
jgi:5-methylcytosine-specific restriction endonuclease McrA